MRSLLTLALSAAIAASILSFAPEALARHFGHRFGHAHGFGYSHGLSGYGSYRSTYGSVRIEVEPRELREEAVVYVDGARAGVVDDFDGIFQWLTLDPGEYKIEIRVDGFRTFSERVFVSPGGTYKLRHRLEPAAGAEIDAMAAQPDTRPTESPRRVLYEQDPADYGAVRIRVKPDEDQAQVYVDGAHAGPVDRFDGAFQRLNLPTGKHEIEVRLAGYRTFREQIFVSPRGTYQIRHQLEALHLVSRAEPNR